MFYFAKDSKGDELEQFLIAGDYEDEQKAEQNENFCFVLKQNELLYN